MQIVHVSRRQVPQLDPSLTDHSDIFIRLDNSPRLENAPADKTGRISDASGRWSTDEVDDNNQGS